MKALSKVRLLTAVGLLAFTSVGWGADGDVKDYVSSSTTQNACINKCMAETVKALCKDPEVLPKCKLQVREDCTGNCGDLPTEKSINDACTAATDKYDEAQKKANSACNAFLQDSTKKQMQTCPEKRTSCKDKIKEMGNSVSKGANCELDDAREECGSTNVLGETAKLLIGQTIQAKTGLNINAANGVMQTPNACVKSIDKKELAKEKKDKATKKSELKNKIKELKDEMVKNQQDIDKERNDVNKDISELEADLRKSTLDKTKTIREKTLESTKAKLEVAKQLRAYSLGITKETQSLANVQFEYQTKMLDLSADRIQQKCTTEFENLKAGIVNSKLASVPANASADERKQYEALAALAAQYKAKGIKGSGELRTMLLNAKKACFEKADVAKSQMKLANSQNVQNIRDRIKEFKDQMVASQDSLKADQTNLESVKTEVANETKSETQLMEEKKNNLNSKLLSLINTTNEKTKSARTRGMELDQELAELNLTDLGDVEAAYQEADEALTSATGLRSRVFASCNCTAPTNLTRDTCTRVRDEAKKIDNKIDFPKIETPAPKK